MRPPANASDNAMPDDPHHRVFRVSAAVASCDPTYPAIPTPAGRVQGQVVVENAPPAIATSTATIG